MTDEREPLRRSIAAVARAELHNQVATEAVFGAVRRMAANGASDAELAIVCESIVLGLMLAGERIYGVTRATTVERLQTMIDGVFERLAAGDRGPMSDGKATEKC